MDLKMFKQHLTAIPGVSDMGFDGTTVKVFLDSEATEDTRDLAKEMVLNHAPGYRVEFIFDGGE